MRGLLCVLVLAIACGDDDGATDAAADVAPDVPSDAPTDQGVDAQPPVECDPAPTPLIAGTTESDALADAPARCGQDAYTWMREGRGELVARTDPERYVVELAIGVLEGFGVTIDPPPPHRVETSTITYRTQERGRDVLATALVASPTTLPPGSDVDVLLFLHGTTGFSDGCGASHTLEYQALAGFFAAYGYVVVLPDYIGLAADSSEVDTGFPHPFIIGEPTAHASLDAVRAALRMDPADRGNVCARPRVVSVGVSQGGHAALWVERLAPYYARELELLGTVSVVPPARLVRETERAFTVRVPTTELSVAILAAHADWYGALDRLDLLFQEPWAADLPGLLWTDCDVDTSVFPDDTSTFFQPALIDAVAMETLADFETFGCTTSQNDLVLTDVPALRQAPVLFLTGELDNTVDPTIERGAFEALCGTAFEGRYLECAGADHIEPILWGVPEIRSFIEARFAGEAFTSECTAPAPTRCEGTPAD